MTFTYRVLGGAKDHVSPAVQICLDTIWRDGKGVPLLSANLMTEDEIRERFLRLRGELDATEALALSAFRLAQQR
jgi:hypothetical protein